MLERIRHIWHRHVSEGEPTPVAWFYAAVVGDSRFMQALYRDVALEVAGRIRQGIILDIGTGPGRLPLQIARLIPEVKVVGLDVSPIMIRAARKRAEKEQLADRVTFMSEDANNLPFETGCFDLVISTASLHHWKDPLRIFNEAYRVLKPDREAWIYELRTDLPQDMRKMLRKSGYGRLVSSLISLGVRTHSGLSLNDLRGILRDGAGKFQRYYVDETWRSDPLLKITLGKD
jgi:SAM-dependent methyltransferase